MPWGLRMLLLFTLLSILFQWYVARKAINAIAEVTRWPRKRIRWSAVAIIFWIVLYPLVLVGSYYLGLGRVSQAFQRSNVAADALVTYPFWIGVIVAVQLTFVFLVTDLAGLFIRLLAPSRREQWLRVKSWLVVALICAGVVYVTARIYNDTLGLRTRQTVLEIKGLPQELDGFRIVQIADLQADGRTNGSKLQAFVDMVNDLKPDLILFGGDLVTSGLDHIVTGAEAMGRMEARHGIYACLGDHDHFSDRNLVTQNLEKNGVSVLDNVATLVPVGSTYVSLTGLTNVYRTRPTQVTLETIEQQRPQGPVNILLSHQPSEWLVSYAREKGYDLLAAGHTHGGQIVFPLPGFLLTGSSFETRYVSGFYRVGQMMVSVTNGLGLTLAPIRYHAPAEVTLILLKAAN